MAEPNATVQLTQAELRRLLTLLFMHEQESEARVQLTRKLSVAHNEAFTTAPAANTH